MKIKLPIFCAVTGALAGIIFWLFLFLINRGTWLLWELIPDKLSGFKAYPLILCTAGGFIIGIVRMLLGDYPEDMMTVFRKLKKEKTYPYKNLPAIIICALLPLVFGASVGPEAGMVGVVAALCCFAADAMKLAKNRSEEYSRIGAAAILSVIFRSPLFGLFDAGENEGEGLTGTSKIILYCIATGSGFGCFYLMNTIFLKVSEGFPSFDSISAGAVDYLLFVPYLLCGIILGFFFLASESFFERIGNSMPPVAGEAIAGALLGAVASFLPVICFSGEEQMGVLISDYAKYAPLAMIGMAFLKIIMTNLCIHLGLKGGHFFPLIFSAVCFGYGAALLIFPGDAVHATFAAAVVAAGTLGVSMKKPLAVSMLLLLCFPASSLLWVVPASALASWAGMKLTGKQHD